MVDLCIVVFYLTATLVVGILAGRGIKTMRDFSVSNRLFPTLVIVSTLFSSFVGGDDLIGHTERTYKIGLIFLLIAIAPCGNMLCTARFVAPKIIRDFSDKISIGEIMESLYGKYGKLICGISNMLFSLGFVAIQISCIGYVFNSLLGISNFYGIIIGSLIVITYSSIGGIRSVVITDAIQFSVLIIGIPLIAAVVLGKAGGIGSLMATLPIDHIQVGPSHPLFWPYMFVVFAFLFPNFLSIDIQRILMAKNISQAQTSFEISALLYIPFYTILSIIGISAYKIFPGIEDANTVFIKVLSESLPCVIKGLAVSGVLAVIMSTSDSFLNSATISAIEDIGSVLYKKPFSEKMKLRVARIVTVLFGISSIFIALCNFESMIEFLMLFFNFWMPVVSAPMLLYLFNYKTDLKTYLFSIVFGFIALIIFRNYTDESSYGLASQFVGMMATFFSMLIFGKLRNKLYNYSAKIVS